MEAIEIAYELASGTTKELKCLPPALIIEEVGRLGSREGNRKLFFCLTFGGHSIKEASPC